MMGLMLQANGKQLIRSENYKDGLEVLTMGEEALSLCNPKVIELIDNVPILQMDMVWCYFMLRDIRWLSVAGALLEKAREGMNMLMGKTTHVLDSSKQVAIQSLQCQFSNVYFPLMAFSSLDKKHKKFSPFLFGITTDS
ncbi:NEDD8 ultimate buster 1-like [Juglans regia]|uniref:NEDD8 ultimate buster 1-like n=1 Tax=Juglans regia TaxID=51240 RepID=A0A6P9ERW1_JUGRE|nr:NEDD8 ultimate buster 1-like [Juglans regia]XP_035550380.1 NEDD8 ultimate buster 1-like [Juglans regia]